MQLSTLRYVLYSVAAALIAAGESFKSSADNVPAADQADGDGVIDTVTTDTTLPASGYVPPAFDSAGLPWDERIHSSTKSIKTDGTWTKRKGATPPTVTAVEAELRAKLGQGIPGTTTTTTTAPLTVPTLGVPLAPTLALPTLAAPTPTKYQQLVAFLAQHTGPGKAVDEAWVNKALSDQGTSLQALATDEGGAEAWHAAFKKALGVA